MMPTTPELMKFKRLQRRLGESIRGTVGLLEMLWIQVSKNCPRGDIGRFSNEEIAIMVDWDGDPDLLVGVLIECGWLDDCAVHRVVVHDWATHSPKWVKGNVTQHMGGFASASPKDCPLGSLPNGPSPREAPYHTQGDSPKDRPPVLPCPTQSSPTQINTMSASSERVKAEYSEDFQIFWESFPKIRRTQKGEAFKRWAAAVKSVDSSVIIERAKEYARSEKGKSQFAVMPSTFLSTKMWEDDPDAWGEVHHSRVATIDQLNNYNPVDGGLS